MHIRVLTYKYVDDIHICIYNCESIFVSNTTPYVYVIKLKDAIAVIELFFYHYYFERMLIWKITDTCSNLRKESNVRWPIARNICQQSYQFWHKTMMLRFSNWTVKNKWILRNNCLIFHFKCWCQILDVLRKFHYERQ